MLLRLLRHGFTPDSTMRRAFPEPVLGRLTAVIAEQELAHSGELRFVVEAALPPLHAWRGQSARERAVELFGQLRIWDTEHNNGVLIYLLMAERNVEIVADRGAAASVPAGNWESICRAMERRFADGDYEAGAREGLQSISKLLARHFPAEADNPNELPDRPLLL